LVIEIGYLIGGNTKGEITISIYVFLEVEYHIDVQDDLPIRRFASGISALCDRKGCKAES